MQTPGATAAKKAGGEGSRSRQRFERDVGSAARLVIRKPRGPLPQRRLAERASRSISNPTVRKCNRTLRKVSRRSTAAKQGWTTMDSNQKVRCNRTLAFQESSTFDRSATSPFTAARPLYVVASNLECTECGIVSLVPRSAFGRPSLRDAVCRPTSCGSVVLRRCAARRSPRAALAPARTRGTVQPYTRFPGEHRRPLSHLSVYL